MYIALYCNIIKTYCTFKCKNTSTAVSDDFCHLAYRGNFFFYVTNSSQRLFQCVYTFVLYKLRTVCI